MSDRREITEHKVQMIVDRYVPEDWGATPYWGMIRELTALVEEEGELGRVEGISQGFDQGRGLR